MQKKTQIVVVGRRRRRAWSWSGVWAPFRPRALRHHPGGAEPHPYLEAAAARGRGRLAGRQSRRGRLSQPLATAGAIASSTARWKAIDRAHARDRDRAHASTRTAARSWAAIASGYDYLVLAHRLGLQRLRHAGRARSIACSSTTGAGRPIPQQACSTIACASRARMSADPAADAYVRVAIVGGGATGVELAAELYNAAAALRYYGLEVFDESRLQGHADRGRTAHPAGAAGRAGRGGARGAGKAGRARPDRHARSPRSTREGMQTSVGRDHRRGPAGLGGGRARRRDMLSRHRRAGDQPRRPAGRAARRCRPRATIASSRIGRLLLLPAAGLATRPVPPRAQAAHQMATTVFDNLDRLMPASRCEPSSTATTARWCRSAAISTVGSLMGNLVGGRMAIEGRLARFVYMSLYRMHLLAIHGWLRGLAFILMSQLNQVVRPKLKLH